MKGGNEETELGVTAKRRKERKERDGVRNEMVSVLENMKRKKMGEDEKHGKRQKGRNLMRSAGDCMTTESC